MLPILVSIPHGGTKTPPELHSMTCITAEALFDDSDAFTREIYAVDAEVERIEKAEVARAFIDLNRAADDRPPANPDGVVKTATCYNEPIYKSGGQPSAELTERLLASYYVPYHARLQEAALHPNLRLALDCHSMAATAPAVAPDSGGRRPLFCLSNDDGRTCPEPLIKRLASALVEAFDIAAREVTLNDPFKGGYITRSHGGGRLPWVQVEMNRSLYLAEPWFDRSTLSVSPERIGDLRQRFLSALELLKL